MAHTRRIRFPGDPPLDPPKIEEPVTERSVSVPMFYGSPSEAVSTQSKGFGAEVVKTMTAAIDANAKPLRDALGNAIGRRLVSPNVVCLLDQLDLSSFLQDVRVASRRSGFRKDSNGNVWFESGNTPRDAPGAVACIDYDINLSLVGVSTEMALTLNDMQLRGASVPFVLRADDKAAALKGFVYLTSFVRTTMAADFVRMEIGLKMSLYTPL